MHPRAHVRIRLASSRACVRFERIGSRPVFESFLNSFREAVPGAQYDQSIGWQVLPIDEVGRLLAFCQSRFAPEQIDVRMEHTTTGAAGQLQFVNM
jgi:hypothetical protein